MPKSAKRSFFSSLVAVCVYIKDHLIECFADFFAWWAGIAYEFPYWCIGGTLIVTLLCCIGMTNVSRRVETITVSQHVSPLFPSLGAMCLFVGFIPGIPQWVDGAEALYSLPYSVSRSEGSVHHAFFNETRTRPTFILVTGTTPGENIFTWTHLEALRQLDRLIRGRAVDGKRRRVGIPRKPDYGEPSMPNPANAVFPKRKTEHDLASRLGSNLTVGDQDAPEVVHRMVKFMNTGADHEGHRGDAGDDILTFQDICDRDAFGECSVSSVLEMGVFDIRKMQPDQKPSLFVFDGIVYNLQKKVFPPHYFLGKAEEKPCVAELPTGALRLVYNASRLRPGSKPGLSQADAMCINEAQGFQLIYELIDKEEYRTRNEAWEKALVEILMDNMDYGPIRVSMNAYRSRDDALRSSTSESSDVLFVGLTFGFIILYSSGLNFSCDLYRSKAYPALSGVLAATLGMIAGMGFISLCGIAFVPTALVCPFLVIGVGTDDMFVIINSYSMTYMVDSPKDRCILSLRDTGLAITLTTVTSLVSFFIGLNTQYLSIKNFCFFCGAGMFFGYIFVLTFFFPFHCLDAKREAGKHVCLFFPSSTSKKNGSTDADLPDLGAGSTKEIEAASTHGADISTFTLGALMVRRAEHTALRHYANRLKKQRMKGLNALDPEEGPHVQHVFNDYPSYLSDQASQATRGSSSPGSGICRKDVGYKRDMPLTAYKASQQLSPDLHSVKLQAQASYASEKFRQQQVEKNSQNASCWSFSFNKMVSLREKVSTMSDYLLSRIAIKGHLAGINRPIEKTPSNGVFNIGVGRDIDKLEGNAEAVLEFFIDRPTIPLYYQSLRTGEKKIFIDEPKGTVGRQWRRFLIRYYGPLLMYPVTKVLVLVTFAIFMAVSLYGCFNLETGLELKDLAPTGSYLNDFDKMQSQYFGEYDFPVDIFFPDYVEWWNPAAHEALRRLQNKMEASGSGKLVTNPFLHMLEDEDLKPYLQSGKREEFQSTLHAALMLEKGKYKQFEQNFVWEGDTLRAWKMQILPAAMSESSERASWMTKIREDCRAQNTAPFPIRVMAWNYMMTYYESDLQINSSVTTNMIVAALTMFVIATLGIPELLAGFLVIVVMAMIDIGIIGFMYFWDVRLNMVSMICLLIAVGFSVDFSAHVCHTFMEAEGQSRDQRVIETLVLMGNPVFHGAVSSILGVLILGFSESYIFRVFFKMMTLVMVFALIHSVVLLPVLLSLIGDPLPHSLKKGHQKSLPLDAPNTTFPSSALTHASSKSSLDVSTEETASDMRSCRVAQPTTVEYPLKLAEVQTSNNSAPQATTSSQKDAASRTNTAKSCSINHTSPQPLKSAPKYVLRPEHRRQASRHRRQLRATTPATDVPQEHRLEKQYEGHCCRPVERYCNVPVMHHSRIRAPERSTKRRFSGDNEVHTCLPADRCGTPKLKRHFPARYRPEASSYRGDTSLQHVPVSNHTVDGIEQYPHQRRCRHEQLSMAVCPDNFSQRQLSNPLELPVGAIAMHETTCCTRPSSSNSLKKARQCPHLLQHQAASQHDASSPSPGSSCCKAHSVFHCSFGTPTSDSTPVPTPFSTNNLPSNCSNCATMDAPSSTCGTPQAFKNAKAAQRPQKSNFDTSAVGSRVAARARYQNAIPPRTAQELYNLSHLSSTRPSLSSSLSPSDGALSKNHRVVLNETRSKTTFNSALKQKQHQQQKKTERGHRECRNQNSAQSNQQASSPFLRQPRLPSTPSDVVRLDESERRKRLRLQYYSLQKAVCHHTSPYCNMSMPSSLEETRMPR